MKERMGPLARSDSVCGIADRGCLALRAWAPPATVLVRFADTGRCFAAPRALLRSALETALMMS
jgi:hypothetical protein